MEETLQTNLNKDNAPLTDDAKTTNSKYDSLKKLKYKDCKRVSIHTEYDYYFNQITTLRFDNKSGKCVSTNESANLSDIIVESCGDNNNINEAVAIVAAGRQDKVTANAGDKLLEKATTSVKVDSKKDTTDPTKDANKPIKDKTKTDQTVSNKVDSPDEENPLALLAEMRRQYKEQKKANKVINCGIDYLFSNIAEQISLTKDLQSFIPKYSNEILSFATFLAVNRSLEDTPFKYWAQNRYMSLSKPLRKSKILKICSKLSNMDFSIFFKSRGHLSRVCMIVDTLSFSANFKGVDLARLDKEKNRVRTPHKTLITLIDQFNNVPVAIWTIQETITSIAQLKPLLKVVSDLYLTSEIKLCLDSSFYSASNIQTLLENRIDFVFVLELSSEAGKNFVKEHSSEVKLEEWFKYQVKKDIQCADFRHTFTYQIEDRGNRPKEMEKILRCRLYHSVSRFKSEVKHFKNDMNKLTDHFLAGHLDNQAKDVLYKFQNKWDNRWTFNDKALINEFKYYGYYVTISNAHRREVQYLLNSVKYRIEIERFFAYSKHDFGLRPRSRKNSKIFKGKLFLMFIALILRIELKNRVSNDWTGAFDEFTFNEIINEIDSLKRHTDCNGVLLRHVITKRQAAFLKALRIPNTLT